MDEKSYEYQRLRAMRWFYGGMCGIDISEQEDGIVTVTQVDAAKTGRIFTQKELLAIGKGFYPRQHVHPHVFAFEGDEVTPEWVRERMDAFCIKQKDLIKNTGLDRSNISSYLSGKRPMSKGVKALFFYYFALLEANKKLHKGDPVADWPPYAESQYATK